MDNDQQALSYTIASPVLPTGALAIYFNFSQSGYNEDNRIHSLSPANTGITGQLKGNLSAGDPNCVTGTVGSGYFNEGYIEIPNGEDLFSPTAWWMYSIRKTTNEPFSVVNGLGDGGYACTSCDQGYGIDIDSTFNQAFTNGESRALGRINESENTANEAQQNIKCAVLGEDFLSLGTFNHRTEAFEYTNSNPLINSLFVDGGVGTRSWFIGSGQYTAPVYLDWLLYGTGTISPSTLNSIAQASCTTYINSGNVSGEFTGQVTGVTVGGAKGTGIRYAMVFSGYTGWTQTFHSTSGVPMTGEASDLISGKDSIFIKVTGTLPPFDTGAYTIGDTSEESWRYSPLGINLTGLLQTPPSELWETSGALGDNARLVITGFEGSGQDFTVQFSGAVYVESGITGTTFSTYTYEGITGDQIDFLATGAASGVSGTNVSCRASYDFTTLTYSAHPSGTGNNMLLYAMGPSLDTSKSADLVSRSIYQPNPSRVFGLDAVYDSTGLIFSMNGVNQYGGSARHFINSCTRRANVEIINGAFYVTGQILITQTPPNVTQSYWGIYDTGEALGRNRVIVKAAPWVAADVASFSANNAQCYLNGVRLPSGSLSVGGAYTIGGGGAFLPNATITDTTGELVSYSNYTGASRVTGLNLFTLTDQSFIRDNFVPFINGIRQRPEDYLQYNPSVCLLTGVEIFKKTDTQLYNNILKDNESEIPGQGEPC